MSRLLKNNISDKIILFFIGLFGFLAFSQVTIISSIYFYFSIVILSCFFIIFLNKIRVSRNLILFYLLYLSPFIISLFSLPISSIIETKYNYDNIFFIGRLLNLILIFISILFIDSFFKTKNNNENFIIKKLFLFKFYKTGILVLLLFGLWQLISFYTSISFPFDTRSHLHSTYGEVYNFSNRLTSIANEPSYFVIFAVDFIGLSLLFEKGSKKLFFIVFSLILIIFSLSPTGFITLFFSFLFAYLFSNIHSFNLKIKSKTFLYLFIFIFSTLIFLLLNQEIFQYILSRITQANPSESVRFYMTIMPFQWALDGNLFSFIFGHGMKSYSLIGDVNLLPSGEPVHSTSNNTFIDIFWEAGLLGLMLVISFFSYMFFRIYRSRLNKKYLFISFYFLFDLFLSSFFRADFSSVRFFIILYLLYLLPLIPQYAKNN